jgi:NTE family protein
MKEKERTQGNGLRSNEGQALVLSGGGARAAYQVGCLVAIAKALPSYRPQILTGASAGAINAVYLAAAKGSWQEAVDQLGTLWRNLSTARVYQTGITPILRRMLHWGLTFASGGRLGDPDIHGMVDNAPLRDYLLQHLSQDGAGITGIQENLSRGLLSALAVIATDYSSGRSVGWIEALDKHRSLGSQVDDRQGEIGVNHIMASAALPMFFPAAAVDGRWYGDGGIRLTAPLSPAMHLGADRILAVSPRATPLTPPNLGASVYPSPSQISGIMLNAIFLDLLDFDALQMQRINDLLARLPLSAHGDLRPVAVMVLRPQEDLGEVAREFEADLPSAFRFFTGGFGGKDDPSADALSMVNFEPGYLAALMDFGEQDTAQRMPEIEAFIRGEIEDQSQSRG